MKRWEFTDGANLRIELWRNAARQRLAEDSLACDSVLNTMKISQKTFDYGNKLGTMIAMNIVTENIGRVKWPADWLQAFKERWFPKFFLRKFPVNYKTVDVKAIYPKCSLENPVLKGIVKRDII